MTKPSTACVSQACDTEKITEAVLPGPIGDTVARGFGPMTVEALIDLCVRMQPVLAAEKRDSTLCVTPLITELIVDGKIVHLELVSGRFGAAYVRVSDERQRSAQSANSRSRGNARQRRQKGASATNSADGYSEAEQLNRQIRYFIAKRQAFRIYSDAGITGEYPIDDIYLIKRLLEGKAARYRKIFARTMLDETSLQKHTPDEIEAMRVYLEYRCEKIKQGGLTEAEVEDSAELAQRAKLRLRGRPRSQTFFRQGLTQMWRDIEADMVHTTTVSDRSRLCRSADLETEFLNLIAAHNVRLHGCIEDLSSLDVGDPIRKGMAYLIASINEYRLEEIAGHCLRGTVQLLTSGNPSGAIPWWLERDETGRAAVIEEHLEVVERIVSLAGTGLGEAAITGKLRETGVKIDGKILTKAQVRYVLHTNAVLGQQQFFGIAWSVFPPVIAPERMTELRIQRAERAATMTNLHDPRTWAEHLFTGVLRCWCGRPLIYSPQPKDRLEAGGSNYYGCKVHHKSSDNSPQHSWVNERKAEAFFTSLLSHHPNIIAAALLSGADGRRHHEVERAAIEGELKAAREVYRVRECEVRETAEKSVLALVGLSNPGFGNLVAATTATMLSEERQKLTDLEQRLLRSGLERNENKQASNAIAALDGAGQWNNLDTLAKNRILRSLFERITVYPFDRTGQPCQHRQGGYMEIKLHGVETPLPPVRQRRPNRKAIDYPTVGEWIDEMLLGDVEPAGHQARDR